MQIYTLIILFVLLLAGTTYLCLKCRRKSREESERQRDLINSLRIQTIRNRLSPHFFFNVLSSIVQTTDPADQLKKEFQTLMMLLRRSVENTEQLAITVREELEVVEGYLSLQKWRIPEQFRFECRIKEGTDMNQLIPAMIIQIPVENALKHGLMPVEGEKILTIAIENYEAGIRITIDDNGIGYKNSGGRAAGTGTGLRILYQTINWLNLSNIHKIEFEISGKSVGNNPEKGTRVEIKIPDNYSYNL